MKKYIVFDTETSGLKDDAEVLQLAGFVMDENFRIIDMINFYCDVTKPLPDKITAITGLTAEKLHEYSEGLFMEDYIDENRDFFDCKNTVFVCHNSDFDTRMVNQTLLNRGCTPINFGTRAGVIPRELGGHNCCICTMKSLSANYSPHKYLSLEDLFKKAYPKEGSLDIAFASLKKLIKEFGVKIPTEELGFHNALFDAYLTLLIFVKFRSVFK